MQSIKIEGTQRFQSVYVSAVEDRVWLSVMHANGSSYINLSADGAEQLIKAVRQSIGQLKQNVMAYEAKETARLDAMFDDRYAEE
jgi:hypothetical protein